MSPRPVRRDGIRKKPSEKAVPVVHLYVMCNTVSDIVFHLSHYILILMAFLFLPLNFTVYTVQLYQLES